MIKKIILFLNIFFVYFASINITLADLQTDLINKITGTNTLSFNFKQQIAESEETGKCIIKYPLRMKCDYKNKKQKIIIANGKTVAIIKKKYKKIYYYPIKTTPLFLILDKEKIFKVIRNNKPVLIDSNLIIYEAIFKNKNKLKIVFDKNSLELRGWQTKDAYSNYVNFTLSDLETNKIINDKLFKIPKVSEL